MRLDSKERLAVRVGPCGCRTGANDSPALVKRSGQRVFAMLVLCANLVLRASAAQSEWPILTHSSATSGSVAKTAGLGLANEGRSQFVVGLSSSGPRLRHETESMTWELRLVSVGSCELSSEEDTDTVESVSTRQSRLIGQMVEEWLEAGPSGWQHGFTVFDDALRDAGGELRLRLRTTGDFSTLPGPGADALIFADKRGGALIRYSGLQVFDADGRIQPSRFEIQQDGFDIVVAAGGAAFPIVVDPWIDPMVVVGPDPVGRLGYSIAMSGNTLVVSSIFDQSGCAGVNCDPASGGILANAGSALIYVRTSTGWEREAYLKASNPGQGDGFGTSVAISGDTVVVGAKAEASNATGVNGNQMNDSAPNAGAAYVFVRQGSTWSQQAYLKASNTRAGFAFGQSVAIDGDMLVVGATGESSDATGVGGNQASVAAPGSGAAYVFVRAGSTWSQQAYLKASNTGSGDAFGSSVAIEGDAIAVAAVFEDSAATGVNGNGSDNSAMNAGAAYVFTRNGGVWSSPDYLKPSNTAAGQNFGYSIDVSGDTIVVGPFNDSAPMLPSCGSVFVFNRSGTAWIEQARLFAPNGGAYDSFGWAVAIKGNQILVGAPIEESSSPGIDGDGQNNSMHDAGACYLFENIGGVWNFRHYIKSSAPLPNGRFGLAVDIDDNVAAVYSYGEFSLGPPVKTGSVRIYEFGTPTQSICAGDGTGTACPCSNSGGPGRGCASSSVAVGALMSSTGDPFLASDSLRLRVDGVGLGAGLIIQGTASLGLDQGQAFGDGLLCVGGQIERLAVLWPYAGSTHYPAIGSSEPPISVLGAVSVPGTRIYQYWYRDATTYCTPSTFNLTNGLSVAWQP